MLLASGTASDTCTDSSVVSESRREAYQTRALQWGLGISRISVFFNEHVPTIDISKGQTDARKHGTISAAGPGCKVLACGADHLAAGQSWDEAAPPCAGRYVKLPVRQTLRARS